MGGHPRKREPSSDSDSNEEETQDQSKVLPPPLKKSKSHKKKEPAKERVIPPRTISTRNNPLANDQQQVMQDNPVINQRSEASNQPQPSTSRNVRHPLNTIASTSTAISKNTFSKINQRKGRGKTTCTFHNRAQDTIRAGGPRPQYVTRPIHKTKSHRLSRYTEEQREAMNEMDRLRELTGEKKKRCRKDFSYVGVRVLPTRGQTIRDMRIPQSPFTPPSRPSKKQFSSVNNQQQKPEGSTPKSCRVQQGSGSPLDPRDLHMAPRVVDAVLNSPYHPFQNVAPRVDTGLHRTVDNLSNNTPCPPDNTEHEDDRQSLYDEHVELDDVGADVNQDDVEGGEQGILNQPSPVASQRSISGAGKENTPEKDISPTKTLVAESSVPNTPRLPPSLSSSDTSPHSHKSGGNQTDSHHSSTKSAVSKPIALDPSPPVSARNRSINQVNHENAPPCGGEKEEISRTDSLNYFEDNVRHPNSQVNNDAGFTDEWDWHVIDRDGRPSLNVPNSISNTIRWVNNQENQTAHLRHIISSSNGRLEDFLIGMMNRTLHSLSDRLEFSTSPGGIRLIDPSEVFSLLCPEFTANWREPTPAPSYPNFDCVGRPTENRRASPLPSNAEADGGLVVQPDNVQHAEFDEIYQELQHRLPINVNAVQLLPHDVQSLRYGNILSIPVMDATMLFMAFQSLREDTMHPFLMIPTLMTFQYCQPGINTDFPPQMVELIRSFVHNPSATEIVFPIFEYEVNHWAVIVAILQERTILYYDGLQNPHLLRSYNPPNQNRNANIIGESQQFDHSDMTMWRLTRIRAVLEYSLNEPQRWLPTLTWPYDMRNHVCGRLPPLQYETDNGILILSFIEFHTNRPVFDTPSNRENLFNLPNGALRIRYLRDLINIASEQRNLNESRRYPD